jgi:hypothetical protein
MCKDDQPRLNVLGLPMVLTSMLTTDLKIWSAKNEPASFVRNEIQQECSGRLTILDGVVRRSSIPYIDDALRQYYDEIIKVILIFRMLPNIKKLFCEYLKC